MTEIKIPDVATLRRLKRISRLAEGQLIAVANQLRVLTAKRNQVLLKAGSTEKTSLYIIEGSISLEARDGQTRVITVDENDELRPVAQLRPCIYDVTALGPVSYMKVDVEKLTEIAENRNRALAISACIRCSATSTRKITPSSTTCITT